MARSYVTAVAAGETQRLYSGVKAFNWYYISSHFVSSDPTRPEGLRPLNQGD
jgi:hypothetical protein